MAKSSKTEKSTIFRDFRSRYGPWSLIAGASKGLGAEFARQLAAHGLNLALIARNEAELAALAAELSQSASVEVRTLAMDLANPTMVENVTRFVQDMDIGLLVYNAAFAPVDSFLDRPLDDRLRELDLNCRAPLTMSYLFGQRMRRNGHGGIILMSSLSANLGSPLIANYAATKAYSLILGEGLWDELKPADVDVLVCCPANIQKAGAPRPLSGPSATSAEIVKAALSALGKRPVVIPGISSRLAAFFMFRILPRRLAIRIMGNALLNQTRQS
jgi:short-subunit dehydrogenase